MIMSFLFPTLIMLAFSSIFKKAWSTVVSGLIWMTLLSMIYIPIESTTFITSSSSMDLMSVVMISLTFLISSLMISASQNYTILNLKPSMFLLTTLMLCYILVLAYSTSNLFNFYIMFEASLIPTLILILGWGYQPERLQAGTYLMMYMISTSLPLLFSLFLILLLNGHLFIPLPYWTSPLSYPKFWWLITILPFLVKTPIYSVHLWLPKAHVEAPVSGSMILAGILLKLGSYGLFRFFFNFYDTANSLSTPILALSLWGACIASMLCLRQTDMKALIAYSSVSHMGLATAGIMSLNLWGWGSALLIMVAHGLISSALFALANMTYETSNSRNLSLIKGIMNIFPALTIWWFILSASNLGAPPSINMLAETMLITATISFSKISMALMFFMVMFTTAYCLLLYSSTQYGPLSNYINPWNMIKQRNHSILMLHTFPALAFFLKSEVYLLW